MEETIVAADATEVEQTENAESQAEQQAESATAEEHQDDTEQGKHREQDKVQRRINRLTREKYQLAAKVQLLEQQLTNPQPQNRETSVSTDRPKLADYASFEEYEDARDAWRDAQAAKKRDEQEQRKKAETVERSWSEKLEKAIKDIPELADEIAAADDIMVSDAMAMAIKDSDIGPQIMLWLARNPEQAEQIAKQSPGAAFRAIGRIEARLEAEELTRKTSSAPKPPSAVKGASSVVRDPDRMNADEWRKWREGELRKQAAR